MRAGQNPAKFLDERSKKTERITVAILTYIPYLQGYYAETLEVLKACLWSLQEHTKLPHDLFVFDNGSGNETREFLEGLYKEGAIDYLFLSNQNLGKGRAWDLIFSAAPGEIIAYADSDVYFEDGWLQNALEVLETYPKVGMVTCRPMRTYEEGHTATVEWARQDPGVELDEGGYLDWETFREHDVSLGQDVQQVRKRFESTHDTRITYKGVEAYAGAAHWQFVSYKHVLNQFLPLGIERPLGDDRKLDNAINEAGYLRLMMTQPLVRHLGNTLPEDLKEGIQSNLSERSAANTPVGKRLLNWPPLRRVLLGIYNRIFRWYFYR
jgi:glycosyltransferase involved in cell wall biosynthesis